MLGSENEYLTGGLTSFIGPQSGCSTSVTMLRAWTKRLLAAFPLISLERAYHAHAPGSA